MVIWSRFNLRSHVSFLWVYMLGVAVCKLACSVENFKILSWKVTGLRISYSTYTVCLCPLQSGLNKVRKLAARQARIIKLGRSIQMQEVQGIRGQAWFECLTGPQYSCIESGKNVTINNWYRLYWRGTEILPQEVFKVYSHGDKLRKYTNLSLSIRPSDVLFKQPT